MIQVIATGCGQGKSTHNRDLIRRLTHTRFLIVVPSVALADEYKDCGTVIHSENSKNVQQRIFNSIENNRRVIVITQKAFLDCPSKALLCENRTVIQDEHLEVFYACNWRMANHMTWLDMFEVSKTAHEGWYEVSVNTTTAQAFKATEDMLDDKQIIDDLLASPHRLFTNRASLVDDSVLYRLISPEVYAGADAVHISCANFTKTRQFHIWTRLFNVPFKVAKPFVRYVTPNLTIHHAAQRYNSKTFNKVNDSIRSAVIEYITGKTSSPVYVDNNCHDDQRGWQRVDHNCHGVNKFRDQQHIAFLSAINHNNLDTTFLREVVGMQPDEIRHAILGEMAHQVLMRGVLRQDNGAVCDVYVMEAELAAYLNQQVFADAKTCLIDSTSRPPKPPTLSPVQRKKACHIRKNFAEFQDIDSHELMSHPIWQMTNTNGCYLKNIKASRGQDAQA